MNRPGDALFLLTGHQSYAITVTTKRKQGNEPMTLFEKSAALTKAYISAKYSNTTADQWHSVMMQAVHVKRDCAREEWSRRDELQRGAALNSQLDLISMWADKAEAVRENAYNAKVRVQ